MSGSLRLKWYARVVWRVISLVLILLPTSPVTAETWSLTIDGHHRFVFGERPLHGYVQIPWQVHIEFDIDQGRFSAGLGNARWLEPVASGGRPDGWVECHLEPGSYLDSSLQMRQMPRVRLARFPVAGALEGGVLTLVPGYEPPGNYLAIQYACVSEREAAGEWFTFAQRARNEEGKRQDADTREQGKRRSAVIREVKTLPPAGQLKLPLRDGWLFEQGQPDAVYFARYRLRLVAP